LRPIRPILWCGSDFSSPDGTLYAFIRVTGIAMMGLLGNLRKEDVIESIPLYRRVLSDPRHLLAFGLGSGLAPVAPGTFGTVAAIPLYWLMSDLPLAAYLGITLVLFLVGCWLCGWSARDLGVHDHSGIVWDEVVGLLITMTAVPAGWGAIALGFGLFRLFDIWKPWPIKGIDARVDGGFGIMLDDVIAGLYAAVCLQLILSLIR